MMYMKCRADEMDQFTVSRTICPSIDRLISHEESLPWSTIILTSKAIFYLHAWNPGYLRLRKAFLGKDHN